ncbi:hypothetical protein BHE90_009520 [Fusarium euwallaceae]|uniref:Uncharacterized protein n=1 Tax=Fusarium euwallaceae TaxID=1147111 RepID=A0A430LJX4_9HYPO|nr:hypothetical protein BHE90_009520 [Fusarium euwallaceae]
MNEEYALLVQRPQFRGDDGPINGPSDDTGIRRRPLHPHVPSAGELRDPDVGSSTIVTPRSSKHLPKRIGWGLWLSILVSFIILVAAVAFLSWLWFKDRQDETWRRVMLSGWSTQAITLTGVLIRFAIGSLGAISTSMIASIAAERHGLPKSALVEVSIARFTNDGPQSFWKHILSGATFKPWMRGIIAVLLLFEVAAQFTSTILLTDLRASHVGSFDQDISHRFTYDLLNTSLNEPLPLESFTHNYWVQKPSSSEIFAEYWKPGKTGEGIDDTGATIIGFLPLAVQSAREALRSFRGMARVVDTRVVCIRPELTARFCYETYPPSYDICGNITADLSNMPQQIWNESLKSDRRQYSGRFKCPILGGPGDSFWKQSWILCGDLSNGVLLGSSLTNATSLENSTAFGGRSWLLVDTALKNQQRPSMEQGQHSHPTWNLVNSTGSGPWLQQWSRTMAEDGNTETEYHLRVSLCFDSSLAADVENLNITASTSSNHTEPIFQYDAETNQYNTSAIRNQLGSIRHNGTRNNTGREILIISDQDMNASLAEIQGKPLRTPYISSTFDWLEIRNVNPFEIPQNLLSQVFTDVLNTTDSPALAIQALKTLLYRLIYYDHISTFTLAPDNATITTFELVRTPNGRWGLIAVLSIIFGNVLLFVIVTLLFLEVTSYSFIQNAWHAVAQVSQSEEAWPLLETATLASDKDMEYWIHGREPPEGIVANVKDFFLDIGRLFQTRETRDSEKLYVKSGVFTTISSR